MGPRPRPPGSTGSCREAIVGCSGWRAAAEEQLSVAGAGGPAEMQILIGGLQGLKGCVRGAIVGCRGWRASGNANCWVAGQLLVAGAGGLRPRSNCWFSRGVDAGDAARRERRGRPSDERAGGTGTGRCRTVTRLSTSIHPRCDLSTPDAIGKVQDGCAKRNAARSFEAK